MSVSQQLYFSPAQLQKQALGTSGGTKGNDDQILPSILKRFGISVALQRISNFLSFEDRKAFVLYLIPHWNNSAPICAKLCDHSNQKESVCTGQFKSAEEHMGLR